MNHDPFGCNKVFRNPKMGSQTTENNFFLSSQISNREVAHTSHEYISWNKNKIYADITMSRIINKFTTIFVILIINSQLIRFCALLHIFFVRVASSIRFARPQYRHEWHIASEISALMLRWWDFFHNFQRRVGGGECDDDDDDELAEFVSFDIMWRES